MFQVNLKIIEMQMGEEMGEQPRFYLTIDHFHYFISDFIPLQGETTQLTIEQSFLVPEENPEFELMLLIGHAQTSKKVVGEAHFNARQWPINEQKTRTIPFSPLLSVTLTIRNNYVASPLSPRSAEGSEIDEMEQRQKQSEFKEQHSFLKSKNERLQQEHMQLLHTHRKLLAEELTKKRMIQQRISKRQYELKSKSSQIQEVKAQLEKTNLQLGAIINLVNDHGEFDICNSVLDLLSRKLSSQL